MVTADKVFLLVPHMLNRIQVITNYEKKKKNNGLMKKNGLKKEKRFVVQNRMQTT